MKLPIVIVTVDSSGHVEFVDYLLVGSAHGLMAELNKMKDHQSVWLSEAIVSRFVRDGITQRRFSTHGTFRPDERINIGGVVCCIKAQEVIDAIVVALSQPDIKAIDIKPQAIIDK